MWNVPIGSSVWTLDPQLVTVFLKTVENLGRTKPNGIGEREGLGFYDALSLSFLKLGGENQTKPNHDQLQDMILYQPSNRGSPQPFQSLYYSIHNKNTVNMWSDFKWRRVQKRKRRWKWEAVGSWGWGSVSCVWFSGFGEGHWSRERPTGRCWIWEKSPELDGREHHAGVV